VTLQQSAAVR